MKIKIKIIISGWILLAIFFLVIIALPLVLTYFMWPDISKVKNTYDFFSLQVGINTFFTIICFFGLLTGGYGLIKVVFILKGLFEKKTVQKTWQPLISIFLIFSTIIAAVAYYNPYWYFQLGWAEPKFGPYISFYGNKGMQISWNTSAKTQTRLYWGDSVQNITNVETGGEYYWEKNSASYHHCVALTELEPGKKYYYKIQDRKSKVFSFRSAPNVSSNEKVEFTIVGDTQYGTDIIQRNIKWMSKYKNDMDFTVICGDLVNRDDDLLAWAMLFHKRAYGKICSGIPIMACPGNHESKCKSQGCEGRANFKKFFQNIFPGKNNAKRQNRDLGLYHSFNFSNVHFILLDLYQVGHTPSVLTESQLEWLERDLTSTKNMWKFIALHEPLYSTGYYGSNTRLAKQLEPIIKRYKVDAVFYGHEHLFEVFRINSGNYFGGTLLFNCSGGGGTHKQVRDPDRMKNRSWGGKINIVKESDGCFDSLYGSRYQLYGEETYHYMHVSVDGDKAVFSAFRTDDNSLIKEYVLKRNTDFEYKKMPYIPLLLLEK